jgi:hypothetical protein
VVHPQEELPREDRPAPVRNPTPLGFTLPGDR